MLPSDKYIESPHKHIVKCGLFDLHEIMIKDGENDVFSRRVKVFLCLGDEGSSSASTNTDISYTLTSTVFRIKPRFPNHLQSIAIG